MKMLLFDIDGTLLYTGGAGRIAFERAMEELFGVRDTWQKIRADGKTDPMLIREVARNGLGRDPNEREYVQIHEAYHRYFREEIGRSPGYRLMPGIPALLERLSTESQFLLGLATGNFEETSYLKLKRGGLDGYFRFGGFGSDSSQRTELVRAAIRRGEALSGRRFGRSEIYVIGDTVHDVRSGVEAGTRTIGVLTGRAAESELREAGADAVFKDFEDVNACLEYLSYE